MYSVTADFTAGASPNDAFSSEIQMELNDGGATVFTAAQPAKTGGAGNSNNTTLRWTGVMSRAYTGGGNLTVKFFDSITTSTTLKATLSNVVVVIYPAPLPTKTFATLNTGEFSGGSASPYLKSLDVSGLPPSDYLLYSVTANFDAGAAPYNAFSNEIYMELNDGGTTVFTVASSANAGSAANSTSTTLRWTGVMSHAYTGGGNLTIKLFDNTSSTLKATLSNVVATIYPATIPAKTFTSFGTTAITSGEAPYTKTLDVAGLPTSVYLLYSVTADFTAAASPHDAYSNEINLELSDGGTTVFKAASLADTGAASSSANTTLRWNGVLSRSYAGGGNLTIKFTDSFTGGSGLYTSTLNNVVVTIYPAESLTNTISGNAGVAGATLTYTDGTAKTVTADSTGAYALSVSYNWSGTVTPSKTGSVFTPASRTYSSVTANQTAQNYVPNIAPTFVGATTTLTVAENASATDITSLLHASDTDAGQTLTWSQNVAPNHGGTLSFSSPAASTGGTNIAPGGTITYTPASGYSGTETFTVQVSDGTTTATRQITVTIVAPPMAGAVSASVPYGSTNNAISLNLSGGMATSVAVNSAASHGTATASGTSIAYTPVAGYAGSDSFTYTATNASGTSVPATVSVWVGSPSIAMGPETPTLPAGLAGTAYSQTITTAGGAAPYSYAISAGALPAGLSLSSGGVLSGTPSVSGPFNFTVTATDSSTGTGPFTGSRAYNLTVNAVAPGAPSIGTATAGDGQATIAFTAPAFTGGASITSYTVTSSPGNLTASGSASPLIVASLNNGTTYTFKVTATNSAGVSVPSAASNEVTPSTDSTPPILIAPTVSILGAGQATLSLASSETGTGYFTILSPAETAGTATQTAAGKNAAGTVTRHGSLALTAATAGSYTVRNLAAETTYTVVFTAKDEADNLQGTPQTTTFKTTATSSVVDTKWKALGTAGFSAGQADYVHLVTAPDGTPYVAYVDLGNGIKASVMKFNGTAWVPVGPAGLSAGTASDLSLAFAPDGTPYVAYADASQFSRATVKRFNGTAWETVGVEGFTSLATNFNVLAFGSDGTPYLAFAGEAGYTATVMKFTGMAWVSMGSSLSTGLAQDLSIVVAADDSLYLAFKEATTGKPSVKHFAGGTWSALGAGNPSSGSVSGLSLALAPNGTLYLAFRDIATTDHRTTVTSYTTATDWTVVGAPGFSAGGEAFAQSLAIAPDGTPYVGYFDNGTYLVGVWKFSGVTTDRPTGWSYVGFPSIPPGSASYVSLALGLNGTPILAYQDGANGYRASVRTLVPAAVITSVDLPAAGHYKAGATLDFTAHFNLPVTVATSGGDALAISFNNGMHADCFAGTNTTSLTFTLTVGNGMNGTLTPEGITQWSNGGTFSFVDADGATIWPYPVLPAMDVSGIVIDTTAPFTPSITTITATAVSGDGEPGATVAVFDGGTSLGGATVGSDRKWTLPVSLSDGSHAITATSTDAAGNASSNSTPIAQVIDTVVPVVTSELTASGTYGAAFSYTITATDDNGLRNYARFFIAGLPEGLNYNDYSGQIFGGPTQVGSFPISVEVYDTYNNKGTATITLTVAKATQAISFNSLYETIYDPAHPTIALGGWSDSGLPISYAVSGPAALTYDPLNGDYLTLNGNGTVTVTASQSGDAHYVAAPDVTQTFMVKSLGQVTIDSAGLNATYDGKPHGVVVTTTPAGLSVEIEYIPYGFSKSMTVVEGVVASENKIPVGLVAPTAVGIYRVYATIDDAVYGGETKASLQIVPATPTTPATTTNNTLPVFSGIADPECIVNVFDGTTLIGSSTASAATADHSTGTWSYTPTTALAEGEHAITITETPIAIEPGPIDSIVAKADTVVAVAAKIPAVPRSAVLTVTIDTTAPATPTIATASGNSTTVTPTLAGTAENSATVKIYDGTTLLGTVTADATTGVWSFTLTTALSDGTHTLTATATDVAGNLGDPSTACTLVVGSAPAITTQPANKTVAAGSPATLTVTATGTATLNYEWQRSVDGSTYVTVANGTTAAYSLASASVTQTGYYRVIVSNAFAPAVTSTPAYLSVTPAFTAARPDGYAASVTGGSAANSVTVLNAADFRTQATATTACTITVVGQLSIGTVQVASNKTIQGADANAALLGNLTIGSGVSNVVVRGLNLTNPGTTIVNGAYTDGGDALTITGASKVFVTHCTFFDCADHDIKITTGADNITVSWCEFYATAATLLHRASVQIGGTSESQPLHVTLHHNWWSNNLDQHLPLSTYGYVHQYSNYFASTGNTAGSLASDQAQFLSERNVYTGLVSPLGKQNVTATLAAGKIRAIGNVYTACTGTTPDAGTDTVFTPSYSYEMLPTSDVANEVAARAGNIAGADVTDDAVGSATITGPAAAVKTGSSLTLTAVSTGFSASAYQWRLNNADISGATSPTYTKSNLQTANAGTYTVAISLASGDTVVSAPLVVAVGTDQGTGKGSGGGSFDAWFCAVLALLGLARSSFGRGWVRKALHR
jgi:VCBS repeat-containing protein